MTRGLQGATISRIAMLLRIRGVIRMGGEDRHILPLDLGHGDFD